MEKLIIKGQRELSGKISISGSKNSTLPILAASILADKTKLKNIPLVKDIFTMVDLLNFIGLRTKIIKKKNMIEIKNDEKNINTLAPSCMNIRIPAKLIPARATRRRTG